MKTLLVAVMAAVLVGCATGSALVTGTARPPIEDFTTVTILTEMPEGAEQIAIVKATSAGGWTEQQKLDYAVEELKQQAAKVGANAIVITGRDTETGVTSSGDTVTSYNKEIVEAVAVYVE